MQSMETKKHTKENKKLQSAKPRFADSKTEKPRTGKPYGEKPYTAKKQSARPKPAGQNPAGRKPESPKAAAPQAEKKAPAPMGNGTERLQKYLATHGIASRRAAEQMIAEGRVKVNGYVVQEMGYKMTPGKDRVSVDDTPVEQKQEMRYILLHKPAGYICSVADEKGRRTVLDLLPEVSERIYPVGRLDYDTAGLLLLTNDGALTHHLLHPSHQVDKTYLAEVEGHPDKTAIQRLRNGVRLSDGRTAPAKVYVVRSKEESTLVEITIHEGRNRQVRRMMDAVGHPVLHLKRTRLAFLDVKDVPMGTWRELTLDEVKRLKKL